MPTPTYLAVVLSSVTMKKKRKRRMSREFVYLPRSVHVELIDVNVS
jgi:hypothetical protein